MDNLPELAVTGSTGHVGGMLARLLAGSGTPQRLLVRDATRAPGLDAAVPLLSSYADKPLAISALSGVRTLFMVSAAEAQDRLQQHNTFVDAAAEAGVEHIIYTSFFGAAPDATFTLARDHYATEEHIKSSGMAFTFLRDNLYTDFLPVFAGEDGVIRGPAADGAAAVVTRADVARCAFAILRDPGVHAGATYNLTGPEDLTLTAAAQIISAQTHRTLSYHAETTEEAYASRAGYGAPPWQVEAWVSTYAAIAAGELSGPTTAVRDLTGKAPPSLPDFLRQE
jgi:NAD(P)H dehydrogenase (quinone)